MSSKRRDPDYFSDILEAMQRIISYTGGLSYEQFMEDRRTQDAVVRNIEVIGEAVKRLSSSLKKQHPTIPWKDMAGMRDKVIHDYFGINYDIVWTVTSEEIPKLVPSVTSVLEKLRG
ncbi:MAG: DUF86 domain-containing protein [Candidatus Binatia bacterium]